MVKNKKEIDLHFYKYKGVIGLRKKKTTGTIASPNEMVAAKTLNSFGITEPKFKKKTPFLPNGNAKIGKVSPFELSRIFEKLASQIEVSIQPSKILEDILFDSFKYNALLFAYRAKLALDEGHSLTDAIASTGVLEKDIVSLIRIGEESGKMLEIFKEVASLMYDRAKIAATLKKAMLKPMGLLISAFGLIMFIVPAMLKPIEGFQAAHGVSGLPLITEIVVATVDFITEHTVLLFASIFFLIFSQLFLYKKNFKYKEIADRIMIDAPLIGIFKQGVAVYLTLLNLYILQRSGVTMERSLNMIISAQSNEEFKKDLTEIQLSVKEGSDFGEALLSSTYIPRLYKDMIRQGENSGRMVAELKKAKEMAGESFKESSEFVIAGITKTIGFVVMIIVAVVIVAAYLPMFSMVGKVLEKMG